MKRHYRCRRLSTGLVPGGRPGREPVGFEGREAKGLETAKVRTCGPGGLINEVLLNPRAMSKSLSKGLMQACVGKTSLADMC